MSSPAPSPAGRTGLWTKNFTLLTVATVLGAAGGIAGNFALSFLVYDQTGSIFASALLLAIQILPNTFVPLVAGPLLDRFPRKPFLVGGDALNGLLYALAGFYLLRFEFSYGGYLVFSLLLACLGSFDSLAYNSILPMLIPAGQEEQGYTVASMTYTVLNVIMTPVAAVLYGAIGVGNILLLQGALSLAAALIESRVRLQEAPRLNGQRFDARLWWQDLKDAAAYLRAEPGLLRIFGYVAISGGLGQGCYPLLIAFFSSTPGFTATMYSFFSAADCVGRSIGGVWKFRHPVLPGKRFRFTFFVYQLYDWMEALLLWLPYPLMLLNRVLVGFFGMNSATIRQAAVQSYIPDEMRGRINAFFGLLTSAACSVLYLLVGALGDALTPRLCYTLCGLLSLAASFTLIWGGRRAVAPVFDPPAAPQPGE